MRVGLAVVILCFAVLPVALPTASACQVTNPTLNYIVCSGEKVSDLQELAAFVLQTAESLLTLAEEGVDLVLDAFDDRCSTIRDLSGNAAAGPLPSAGDVCDDPAGSLGSLVGDGQAEAADAIDSAKTLVSNAPNYLPKPTLPSVAPPTLPPPSTPNGPSAPSPQPPQVPALSPPKPGVPPVTVPGPPAGPSQTPSPTVPAPQLPPGNAPGIPAPPPPPGPPGPEVPPPTVPEAPSAPSPTPEPTPTGPQEPPGQVHATSAPSPTPEPAPPEPEDSGKMVGGTSDPEEPPAVVGVDMQLPPLMPKEEAPSQGPAAPPGAAAPPPRELAPLTQDVAPPALPAVAVEMVTLALVSGGGLLWLFHLLFYNRLTRNRVELSSIRRRLLDRIRSHPASTIPDMARALGIHTTTVSYHLRVLERYGHIVVHADSANRWYFENHGRYEPGARKVWAAVRRQAYRDFLVAVRETGGGRLIDVAGRLGVPVSTAGYRAGVLVDAKLLVREGRTWRLTEAALEVLRHPALPPPAAPQPREAVPFIPRPSP